MIFCEESVPLTMVGTARRYPEWERRGYGGVKECTDARQHGEHQNAGCWRRDEVWLRSPKQQLVDAIQERREKFDMKLDADRCFFLRSCWRAWHLSKTAIEQDSGGRLTRCWRSAVLSLRANNRSTPLKSAFDSWVRHFHDEVMRDIVQQKLLFLVVAVT